MLEKLELKCPKCGKLMKTYEKGYACSGYPKECDFLMPKVIGSKFISKNEFYNLFTNKETNIINGFVGKNGQMFDAKLMLDENYKLKFVLKDELLSKQNETSKKPKKEKKKDKKGRSRFPRPPGAPGAFPRPFG